MQVELRNPAVPSPSCPISHRISPTGAGFSPGTAPKPRGRCARSARLSVPFLPLLLTCPFNAFSHLGFKLASCCLRLLCRFASSLLGVGTIICLFFSPALLYIHMIKINIVLAFQLLCRSTTAICCGLCHAKRDVDIYEIFPFTSDCVDPLTCNFLKTKLTKQPSLRSEISARLPQKHPSKFCPFQAGPERCVPMSF